jgi:4a-hydroxytetrahydrobiopterin dehydratase
MQALSREEVEKQLKNLGCWQLEKNAIVREFQFASFRESLAFVNAIGAHAEQVDHHPDIDIRYNRVYLRLWTHDAGGLTHRDVDFAAQINTRYP